MPLRQITETKSVRETHRNFLCSYSYSRTVPSAFASVRCMFKSFSTVDSCSIHACRGLEKGSENTADMLHRA